MKIDFSSAVQQTQTELNEKFFSISDPAFIFDLLRNKIYSNPILAVCRELSCNALDAHREVGKGDEPIVITLPNSQDPYFKVRDFGPGISPSRIDDIYLKYAASTKRESNDQIGAFGIGAKSPFSYSDSFTIVTNHEGKCYNYMAFIDESRMGKLILLSESETTDPNGTEVIVPIRPGDYYNFVENIEKCTRHWSVKPKFLGGTIAYRKVNALIGNEDWFISDDRENYYERKVKVLVGEIEYNLDTSALKTFCDLSILSAVSTDVYLRFNVGDVSLAANRESIYLDQDTKDKVSDRMRRIKSNYISMVREKIASQPTYWDACCFVANDLSNLCQDPSILKPIQWNGLDVVNRIRTTEDFSIWEFYKRSSGWGGNVKIQRRFAGEISPNKLSKIIIHDCGTSEPTSRHLKQFFEGAEEKTHFYVVHPKNSDKEDFSMEEFIKSSNLHLFDLQFLSKHNKQIRTKKTSEKVKLMTYKMDAHGSFTLMPQSEISNDINKKLFVYLRKDTFRNRKLPVDLEKKLMDSYQLRSILDSDKNISIYGVDENIEEERVLSVIKGATFVTDYIDDWFSNLDQDSYFECMWANQEMDSFRSNCRGAKYFDLEGKIRDENSPMSKFLNHYKTVSSSLNSNKGMISMLTTFGKLYQESPEFEAFCQSKQKIVNLYADTKATYPLLDILDNYRSSGYTSQIADYVNLVDKSNLTA